MKFPLPRIPSPRDVCCKQIHRFGGGPGMGAGFGSAVWDGASVWRRLTRKLSLEKKYFEGEKEDVFDFDCLSEETPQQKEGEFELLFWITSDFSLPVSEEIYRWSRGITSLLSTGTRNTEFDYADFSGSFLFSSWRNELSDDVISLFLFIRHSE